MAGGVKDSKYAGSTGPKQDKILESADKPGSKSVTQKIINRRKTQQQQLNEIFNKPRGGK